MKRSNVLFACLTSFLLMSSTALSLVERDVNATTTAVTTAPATGTPASGANFSILTVSGNGCSANPATIQGNTVFLSGATASAGGAPLSCTVVIGIQNGEALKDLTFVHSFDMLLGRKIQHWCYLDYSRSFCVQEYYPYARCDKCVYTTMGNQYYVARFDAAYSGCGVEDTQHADYSPEAVQSSWRASKSLRKSFKPNCASSDTFTVTIGHAVNEAGDSLGGGWDYESTSYIAEHTISISKAPASGSSASSLGLGYWPLTVIIGAFALLF